MFKFTKTILLALLVMLAVKVKAQEGGHYTDFQGHPIAGNIYPDIEGIPFLFDQWLPGNATTDKGKVYDNLKLKYNVYDEMLIFTYTDDAGALRFSDPIKSFTIMYPQESQFANGFPAIDKQTSLSYYQVVAPGKTMLLKRYFKTVIESKGYNSNVVVRRFEDADAYYIYNGSHMIPVKRSKGAISEALADKGGKVDSWLKSNSINFKKDTDLKKLFDYYNSI